MKYNDLLEANLPNIWIGTILMCLEKYEISLDLKNTLLEAQSNQHSVVPFEMIRKEINASKKDMIELYKCVKATTIIDSRTNKTSFCWLHWKVEK